MNQIADTVIYGNFYTVDKNQPKAEAVAIKDGIFVYVGNVEGVKNYIGENTEVVRNDDGMILPGLVDGHAHCNLAVTQLFMCLLYGCTTVEEIRESLKKFIAEHEDFDVIQGIGWSDGTFGENGPAAAMIDDLTDKPVVLIDSSFHSYWLNSAAMKLKGIDKNTPDVSGGRIHRDADGNPTGCFREGAVKYLEDLVLHFPIEQYKQAILHFQDLVLANGITMFFDPMTNLNGPEKDVEEAYHQLDVEGKLKVHAHGGYQVIIDRNPVETVEHAAKLREKTKGAHFDLDHIKILLDGVLEGKTAYLSEPYCNNDESNKDYCGVVCFDFETLKAVVKKSDEFGFIVHIHSIGDESTKMALDAFEKAQSSTEMRNAITHLQLVNPKDIKRMAELGIVAVSNPYWFIKDPVGHKVLAVPYLGEKRAEEQYPLKSFFDAGIIVTTACDYPVTTVPTPLLAIQRAVMRQLPNRPETLLGGNERVTVEQMIEATTLNGAYQFKCEDKLGSITVGKQADLAVLDTDITACKPENIADTKVLRTMIGGEWVYTRAE